MTWLVAHWWTSLVAGGAAGAAVGTLAGAWLERRRPKSGARRR